MHTNDVYVGRCYRLVSLKIYYFITHSQFGRAFLNFAIRSSDLRILEDLFVKADKNGGK